MNSSTVEVLKAAATLFLGVAGFSFTVVTWTLSRRAEREKRDDQLLAWSSRAIDVMARIDALSRFGSNDLPDQDFRLRKAELTAEVSAILDQGRLFFPNIGGEGRHDPSATGLRPQILDELRVAYLVAEGASATTPLRNKYRRDELWDARGRFIGYLRAAVGDNRKRDIPAGKPGRSVALDELPPEAAMADYKPYLTVHRR